MDLHKQINSLSGELASEAIDGANVWELQPADRVRVAAFMRARIFASIELLVMTGPLLRLRHQVARGNGPTVVKRAADTLRAVSSHSVNSFYAFADEETVKSPKPHPNRHLSSSAPSAIHALLASN